jgi:hypothetical protein
MRPAWFKFVATAGRWCWPDCQDSFGLGTATSQIRTALVSLGNHALALVSQTGLSKEILAFPPVQFWITPSTEFTMGGFALFAILAFTGVANMNKRFRPLLTGVYVLAALPLLIGCLQAARQEQAAAETQKLSASLANPTQPVQPDIALRLLDPKEPTEDRDQVDVDISAKSPTHYDSASHTS